MGADILDFFFLNSDPDLIKSGKIFTTSLWSTFCQLSACAVPPYMKIDIHTRKK